MTAHFRLPWAFGDLFSSWESGSSLLSANDHSLIDHEALRAADVYFPHALLTYPLDDALLSSAASFSHSLATRAFDFAGPSSLEQIMQAPNWTDTRTVVIDNPLAPIPTGDPNAALIWANAGAIAIDDPLAPIPTGDPNAALIWTHAGAALNAPALADWGGAAPGPLPDADAQFAGATTPFGAETSGPDLAVFSEPVHGMVDYSRADYGLQLDHTLMPQLGALGPLAQEAFHVGSAATDSSDRIIYNAATGALYYDPDGAGAATQVHIANLSPGLSLTAGMFIVI